MVTSLMLSVVVPCYNVELYLDRCLASLRDQDMGPDEYEIIVVDDGSTDGTLRLAREHAASDPRVVVHHQENLGLSAARNAGLDRAMGDYVYFVDGDDYVASGVLRSVVESMREHSLDLAEIRWRRVQPDEVVISERSMTGAVRVTSINSGIDHLVDHLDYPSSVWSFLIDRPFLETTGCRFDVGRLFEDQAFVAEVLSMAQRVACVEQDVYRYVVRPGSITRDRDPDHARRLIGDLEHLVHRLDGIRQHAIAEDQWSCAYLDRIATMQEGYIFFLITRVIRSTVPLRPLLPDTLDRLRATGHYPLKAFPGREHAGLRFRVFATVFNHRTLVYPFAYAYRAGAFVLRNARRRSAD